MTLQEHLTRAKEMLLQSEPDITGALAVLPHIAKLHQRFKSYKRSGGYNRKLDAWLPKKRTPEIRMNCPTCGRSHSECQCTAAKMFLDDCGLGFRLRPDTRDTKSQRILYAIAFNMMVIAGFAAMVAGGRLAYVWWVTR